jgi:hypothetical protein
MRRTTAGMLATTCLCLLATFAQANAPRSGTFLHHPSDTTSPSGLSPEKLSDHALQVLNNRYALLNRLVQRQTEKMLLRMQKKELALQRQLQGKDSVKARALFDRTQADYQRLLAQMQAGTNAGGSGLTNIGGAAGGGAATNIGGVANLGIGSGAGAVTNPLRQYIPGVDSMQTALRFLGRLNSGQTGIQSLMPSQLQGAQSASQQLLQLQGTLQNANEVQSFLRQREQDLRDQLMNSGVGKQLRAINQEAYYYQAQLSQYKDMLNDPDKMTQAVLGAVRQVPAFQKFWQQNSYFSQLFPAPAPGVAGTPQALAGLQTREQVQKEVQDRLELSANAQATQAAEKAGSSGGGGGGLAYLQQQIQKMETQVQQMKNHIAQYGTGSTTGLSNGNMTTPDFQPNSQHTKTFLKRIQYSFVIQNSPSSGVLPAISSLGLNIGYKLSDKATVGVGGSYLLGLGYPLNHFQLSNQGVGVRSFVDIRARGSIWITGGFEYNYLQQFTTLRDIPHLDVWQRSALIGITKKYRIGQRENNLQLLYDLLAGSEVPRGQPFVFRLGFGF